MMSVPKITKHKQQSSGRWFGGGRLARLEQSEREERHHARRRLRSAYLSIIDETPDIRVGHAVSAAEMLARIRRAWSERHRFTPAERDRLSMLRAKWRRRAAGEDARYNTHGTRRGRPTHQEQANTRAYAHMKDLKRWVEDEQAKWEHPSRYLRKRLRDAEEDRGD